MNKLSAKAFEQVYESIRKYGRNLENALLNTYFDDGAISQVVYEYKQFQNSDGGFGHGLEPDFRLPDSSAAATNFALRTLTSLEQTNEVQDLINNAIQYLEESYTDDRPGWYNVPPEVNNHPRAQWWTVDRETNKSGLDNYWGNPNAELTGYLYDNQDNTSLDVDNLVDYAIDHFNSGTHDDIHEIYAYVELFKRLPEDKQEELRPRLILAVSNLVSTNINEWDQYVPKPLDIVKYPDGRKFGLYDHAIEDNLHFLIEKLDKKSYIEPSWSWNGYKDVWEKVRKEWIGILTLQALKRLQNFDRITSSQ